MLWPLAQVGMGYYELKYCALPPFERGHSPGMLSMSGALILCPTAKASHKLNNKAYSRRHFLEEAPRHAAEVWVPLRRGHPPLAMHLRPRLPLPLPLLLHNPLLLLLLLPALLPSLLWLLPPSGLPLRCVRPRPCGAATATATAGITRLDAWPAAVGRPPLPAR